MKFSDLHCDTPSKCYETGENLIGNPFAVSAEKGECFEKWIQTFAIWIKDDRDLPWEYYCAVRDDFKNKLKNKPADLTSVFAVEGGAVIGKDPEKLQILKNDGVSFLTLTWNGENAIAGGSKSDKGLTEFGKTVISDMNYLKIGCDLSHINEKSFYPALERADFPLATHSCCYEICPHVRNLKIRQIKMIAQKGGIVGLCFYPPFLGGDVFEKLYGNIFVLCDAGLENSLAIGSDFDGGIMDKRLDGIEKVPFLYNYLKTKGITEKILDKIFYENTEKMLQKRLKSGII